MRLVFAGTPAFAEVILSTLCKSRHSVVAVLTQPDRPAGRKRRPAPPPVKVFAQSQGLDVLQHRQLDPSAIEAIRGYYPDTIVVAAYGLLLPAALLALPRFGCINIHASLLPRWRGAAPVEHALLAGDTRTGVSIMLMDRGLDTGPIYTQAPCEIRETDIGGAVEDRIAQLAGEPLLRVLNDLESERAVAVPQRGESTYAPKLTKEDSRINWKAAASVIEKQVRAMQPRQPTFSYLGGERIRLLGATPTEEDAETPGRVTRVTPEFFTVACGQGSLEIRMIQLTRGKGRAMTVAELQRGYPDMIAPGSTFDSNAG